MTDKQYEELLKMSEKVEIITKQEIYNDLKSILKKMSNYGYDDVFARQPFGDIINWLNILCQNLEEDLKGAS